MQSINSLKTKQKNNAININTHIHGYQLSESSTVLQDNPLGISSRNSHVYNLKS